MYIPIILGTAREGRQSEKVAKYILPFVQKREGIETEIIDVEDFLFGKTIPGSEDIPQAYGWKKIAKRADGFIIVSPEYNHGFPGELKILLDSAYDEYEKKPVTVASVSDGIFGGARMVEMLIHTLRKLKLVTMLNPLHFPKVDTLFDDKVEILDKSYEKRIEKFLDEFMWYVETLKYGRENIKKS